MVRVFFAVDIPASEAMQELLRGLRGVPGLKPVEAENLHLTLKFLGEVPEAATPKLVAALEAAAEGHHAFPLTVSGTGAFPRWTSPKVLWLGVQDGGRMAALAHALEARCLPLGFQPEGRPFSPHLTLARVKSGRAESAVSLLRERQGETFAAFEVGSVKLKKSTLKPQGPVYEDLGMVELAHGL